MGRAKNSRARRSNRGSGLSRLLTDGIQFDGGVVVRLSRPEEHEAVQAYKWMADPEGEWKPAIANCNSVEAGITRGPNGYTKAIGARWQRGLMQGTARYSLVAAHNDQIIGAIDCSPPHRFMDSVAQREVYDPITVYSTLTVGVSKINAIAVDPISRNTGVGQALITTAARISQRCGHQVMYGNCGSDALPFYRKAGFTIYSARSPLDLGNVLPGTAVICSTGDYLFGRSLN